jgi:hypothetical protein
MPQLVFSQFSHKLLLSLIVFVVIFTLALFAPTPQSAFTRDAFGELTFLFPFFTFAALLHSCP